MDKGRHCSSGHYRIYRLQLLQVLLIMHILPSSLGFNIDVPNANIYRKEPDTYFGYTVGLQKDGSGYKLFVGAPKYIDKSSSISGRLYTCGTNTCAPFHLQEDPNTYEREDQWLGATLDMNPNPKSTETSFIVCAPRFQWIDRDYTTLRGICYAMTGSRQQTYRYDTDLVFGMSARYSSDGVFIAIGEPLKKGGWYYIHRRSNRGDYIPFHGHNDMYAGYAVDFLKHLIVVGVPRYYQYGAVKIQDQTIRSPKTPYAFGSYFGSAIAVGDVNNDSYFDLIIGAPFYSETFTEEGRVYVFYNKGNEVFPTNANVVLSVPSYRSQFGKTLATGDINGDGFQDIIVGAPYENQGTGCIYIFNGHQNGMDTIPSQKIQGTSFNVTSFGISFSRLTDIDENGYPDLAIGAYLSDAAMVLRARPIIHVEKNFTAFPNPLNPIPNCVVKKRKVLCVNVTVYMVMRLQNTVEMNIHFSTDITKPSNEKRTILSNEQTELSETVTVNNIFKKVYSVIVENTVNILEPIDFSFAYSLVNDGYSSSCTLCPVLKNNTLTTHVKFTIGCGADEQCNTYYELKLAHPSANSLLSGEKDNIIFIAIVKNVLEHAYYAKAIIYYPSWLEYESIKKSNDTVKDVKCSTTKNQQELSCFMGNPLRENSTATFYLTFSINWTPQPQDIVMHLMATTISHVPDQYLNTTNTLTIPVYMKSNLSLSASSNPDTYPFHETSAAKIILIKHVYHLENKGPSVGHNLTFKVNIPQATFNNITVLKLNATKIIDPEKGVAPIKTASCYITPLVSSKDYYEMVPEDILKYTDYNCNWLECREVICSIDKLEKNRLKVIEISLSFDTEYLKILTINTLNVSTTGNLTQEDGPKVITQDNVMKTTTTTFYTLRKKTGIKWWILVCSIAIGLFILTMFSLLLYKCGFFMRQRAGGEDTKELKNEKTEEVQEEQVKLQNNERDN